MKNTTIAKMQKEANMSKKFEITNDTKIVRHKPLARVSHWFLVISFL